MYIKLLSKIIIFVFVVFINFAQAESEIVADMIDGLKAYKAQSIIIPGDTGVLNIYIDKNSADDMIFHNVALIYNGMKSTFQIKGNIAITQNGILVFAQNDGKVYISASNNSKENLILNFGQVEFMYHSKSVNIKYNDKIYSVVEALYDSNENTFTEYKNGKPVKTVKLEK